ncbi:MAG: Y-family DNA polymerase [Bacteroidota bacterium]
MIGIIDCNSFYASCERIFQPKLEGKPVIVLSNNDGCAIALTDEAKALGIKMGTPAHYIDKDVLLKNNVTMFSSNYTLYGDISKRVTDTIGEFVPRMEIYSIDEAFIDLSGIAMKDIEPLAHKIRQTIKQHIGIPVTIGIAKTKTLAKLCNRFAKKTKKDGGVHIATTQQQVDEVLHFTQIGDVWGIGAQHAKMLQLHKIKTAYDFIQLPQQWVLKEMTVVGLRMYRELMQQASIKWEFQPPRKKNIATGRSFGKLLSDAPTIAEALSNYAGNVALKLRQEKSCAKALTVFLNTNPFRPEDKQYARSITLELPVATNSTNEIVAYALKGFHYIYAEGYNFLKVGVNVGEIVPEENVQIGLFDETDRDKNNKVMKALDTINNIYGRDTVRLAVQGFEKKWKMRQARLSNRYTTNINQLLTVKI